jgi:hypothetical protein
MLPRWDWTRSMMQNWTQSITNKWCNSSSHLIRDKNRITNRKWTNKWCRAKAPKGSRVITRPLDSQTKNGTKCKLLQKHPCSGLMMMNFKTLRSISTKEQLLLRRSTLAINRMPRTFNIIQLTRLQHPVHFWWMVISKTDTKTYEMITKLT